MDRRPKSALAVLVASLVLLPVPASLSGTRLPGLEVGGDDDGSMVRTSTLVEVARPSAEPELDSVTLSVPEPERRVERRTAAPARAAAPCKPNPRSMDVSAVRLLTRRGCGTAGTASRTSELGDEIRDRVRERIASR